MPRTSDCNNIQQSNDTLNYLLGGRSKSWMTSAPLSDRKTPQNDSSPRKGSGRSQNQRNSTDSQPDSVDHGQQAVNTDSVPAAPEKSSKMGPREAYVPGSSAYTAGAQLLSPAGSRSRSPYHYGPPNEQNEWSPQRETLENSPAHLSMVAPANPTATPVSAARASAAYPNSAWAESTRPMAPDFFDPRRCNGLISCFLLSETSHDPPPQLSACEELRMQLLRSASRDRDTTFLMVHQLYCIGFDIPNALPARFRSRRDVIATFQMLDDVWQCPRSKLSQPVLAFWTNFPAPLVEIMTVTPQAYESRFDQVDHFFRESAASLSRAKATVLRRGYPPMASEIFEWTGVSSPNLQKVIFTLFIHFLWQVRDSPFIGRAIDLFSINVSDWQRVEAREPKHPISEQALKAYDDWFIVRYMSLRKLEVQSWQIDPALTPIPDDSPLQDLRHSPVGLLLEQQYQTSRPTSRYGQSTPLQPGGGTPVQAASNPQQANESTGRTLIPAALATGGEAAPSSIEGPRPPAERSDSHQSVRYLSLAAQLQGQLQDPLISQLNLPSDGQPDHFFQYPSGFEVAPCGFTRDTYFRLESRFDIDNEVFERVPKQAFDQQLRRNVRGLDENSVQYRVRSCLVKDLRGHTAELSKWTVCDTSWHPNVYFKLNGHHLEIRKRLQHGQDTAVDVTDLIRPGTNNLEIFANVLEGDTTPYEYLFALEVVLLAAFGSVGQYCLSNFIQASKSLESILAELSDANSRPPTGTPHTREVDGAVETTSVSLSIPITALCNNSDMFEVPVRGRGCGHHQCFDLESYLRTRPMDCAPPSRPQASSSAPSAELPETVSEASGVPSSNPQGDASSKLQMPESLSSADCWRCPICKGDARPRQLVIDGFLVSVREKLQRMDLMDTPAIIVYADGNWYPKARID